MEFDDHFYQQQQQQRSKKLLIFFLFLSIFVMLYLSNKAYFDKTISEEPGLDNDYINNQDDNDSEQYSESNSYYYNLICLGSIAQDIKHHNKTNITKQNQTHNNCIEQFRKWNQSQIIDSLLQTLKGIEFIGEWNSNFTNDKQNTQKFLDNFDNYKGKIGVKFYPYEGINYLYISLFDGKYRDLFSATIHGNINTNTDIESISEQEVALKLDYTLVNVSYNFMFQQSQTCRIQLKIKFDLELDIDGVDKVYYPHLKLDLSSENCNQLNFTTTILSEDQDSKKSMMYSLFASSIGIVHFSIVIRVLKRLMNSESSNQVYSIITLGLIFIWDGFICFIHVLASTVFQYFATPSFIYLILWMVFERTLLVHIWKTRNQQLFTTDLNYRKELFKFYTKLYLSMLILTILTATYILNNIFLVLINLYMIPQILHTAIRGQYTNNDNLYLGGLLVLRSLYPLYLRGCPDNIFSISPSYLTCFSIIFIVGLQSYYGPRFFIPAMFLPNKYNYFQKIPDNIDIEMGIDNEQMEDCVICMAPLHIAQNPNQELLIQIKQPYLRKIIQSQNQYMKSPCNHKFHTTCLLKWMTIKMECPTCRSQLPSAD